MKSFFPRRLFRPSRDTDPSAPEQARSLGRLRWRSPLPLTTLLSFAAAALSVVAIAVANYQSHMQRLAVADAISHAGQVSNQLQQMMSRLLEAESAQRGFLLTEDDGYLASYAPARDAVPTHLQALRELFQNEPQQLERIDGLAQLAQTKLDELSQTVALARAGQREQALELVRSDLGQDVMERASSEFQVINHSELALAQRQRQTWSAIVNRTLVINIAGAALLLLLIGVASVSAIADHRRRSREAWARKGQLLLAGQLQGDPRLEQMADNAIATMAQLLDAPIGAMHVTQPNGELLRVGGYALAGLEASPVTLPGQGLVSQAASRKQVLHVRDVPPGYLPISSSLGQASPRELVLVPALAHGRVQAVLELGFFRAIGDAELELLQALANHLAVSVRAAKDRTRLEELLEETQRQTEELQTQQEELRVSNEGLEAQSRSLKESQSQLQNQQAELEQNNLQLAHQASELAAQRDQLAGAQQALAERADKLERASQYKSEFLANMSHELRTPLNSTLILAKLLADNKDGNLSAEQVKYAETISSAGNDLLSLINDILDLAKIESGKVETDWRPLSLAKLLAGLRQTFEPMALERGLVLRIEAAEGNMPAALVTDEQRLGQVLKNLLSNALKFTDRGEVSLQVSAHADTQTLQFAVQDSGIGISADKLDAIFDAFVQEDGSTHRKYGGTGLGLAISRDLARLLGGDIRVDSHLGRGSTFTLTLPWDASAGESGNPATNPQQPERTPQPAPMPVSRASASPVVAPISVPDSAPEDDRATLQHGQRTILVIEDDVRFAAILKSLSHEAGFQCVLTHTATAGLEAARAYQPSAILLDMNLPDLSGLGVLDQLKRDPRTRHVPVHVLSVADYSHDALEMGAVGYALKPVNRDQLLGTLAQLEARIAQTVKRVLVVEDDERQRQSVQQLLAGDDVQITAVETASAALEALASTTFDCMVMDLSLPDMNGYQLLEHMSAAEGAFPPVIVYTGRSLSREQEAALRRFSRSIIIKGARSPERLLAEVTLFLHQVETQLPADRQRMLKQARNRETWLEGSRVLVVEDDVRNIFALSAVLEPKGMIVEIARNGREAVEALDATLSAAPAKPPVDLVLMDIMMPEMDGYTAMRQIRQRPAFAKLPIIALTAKAMRNDQEKCLAAGANDYIAKPLDVEKLMSLIRVWIRK